ncbi:MAG: CpaE family protein [Phenylobacterium sp.]|uniref:AAA family ATPase n=1 Tax=Phenylobacterium sp. TaxID=1871053 RepID=UPI00391C91CD
MTHWSLLGRRVLAIGPDLPALARGPLFGAALELGRLERLGEARAETTDLLLIDADGADEAALASALAELASQGAPPPTLLLGSRLPASLVRTLLRLPVSDVLETPFSDEDLLNAVYALLDAAGAQASAAAGPRSRCWTIMGAVGGAGATTIAIEAACALARRSRKDRSVCLVDLNLADGATAAYLGATPAMGLASFGPAAERMDAALLAAFATPIGKGLDLLACPRDPQGFDEISREAVLRILEIACEAYDHVVVDMPRHRRGWTLEVLAGSDEVLIISELTVPALLAARALSEEIEQALPTGARPRIVLNRLASRMFGAAPSLAEAERALQRKADGGVSSDWDAAAASVNLGGPISQHRPKSKIVRDVDALVERIAGREERRAGAAPRAA